MKLKYTFFFILSCIITVTELFGQTAAASRTDGIEIFYYSTLHEAIANASGSFSQPDEITILADLALDEPLTIADGVHIRLVAGGADRIIRRSSKNIEFPVIWVNGENASLTLGKPGMEYELVFDGGYLSVPSIQAHAPLAAISGLDSKLIMYDKVTLQNNYNIGIPKGTSHYLNGAGVFIRTVEDVQERQAEFVMKGGTIRGNINDIQTELARGGALFIAGFGLFAMEGGVIADNTARYSGGGIHVGGRGSFKKTGGIIYGKDAPYGMRNTALEGYMLKAIGPKTFGHAINVAGNKKDTFRNDTVYENDRLSYTGSPAASIPVFFGEGDKWDNSDKVFLRWLFTIIIPSALAAGVIIFIILKTIWKKQLEAALRTVENTPEINLEGFDLTDREKEICKLLLSELTFKEISSVMKLSNSGVKYHSQNLYRKLGIQSRTELFVKLGKGS